MRRNAARMFIIDRKITRIRKLFSARFRKLGQDMLFIPYDAGERNRYSSFMNLLTLMFMQFTQRLRDNL